MENRYTRKVTLQNGAADQFGQTEVLWNTTLGKKFERFKKTHTFMDSEREEHGKLHSVCVIDSIPSQANRIEPAFAVSFT